MNRRPVDYVFIIVSELKWYFDIFFSLNIKYTYYIRNLLCFQKKLNVIILSDIFIVYTCFIIKAKRLERSVMISKLLALDCNKGRNLLNEAKNTQA